MRRICCHLKACLHLIWFLWSGRNTEHRGCSYPPDQPPSCAIAATALSTNNATWSLFARKRAQHGHHWPQVCKGANIIVGSPKLIENGFGSRVAGVAEAKTNEWTRSTKCEWGKQRTCQQALLWKQENPTCTRCKHFRVPACYIFINTRHICHLVRVTQFYVESVWWEAEIDSCDHVLNEWCTYHI